VFIYLSLSSLRSPHEDGNEEQNDKNVFKHFGRIGLDWIVCPTWLVLIIIMAYFDLRMIKNSFIIYNLRRRNTSLVQLLIAT
jgi:hypothetical protein